MTKRKRNENENDNDTESDTEDILIYTNNNKIYFYCDVNSRNILELIKSLNKTKKNIISNNLE